MAGHRMCVKKYPSQRGFNFAADVPYEIRLSLANRMHPAAKTSLARDLTASSQLSHFKSIIKYKGVCSPAQLLQTSQEVRCPLQYTQNSTLCAQHSALHTCLYISTDTPIEDAIKSIRKNEVASLLCTCYTAHTHKTALRRMLILTALTVFVHTSAIAVLASCSPCSHLAYQGPAMLQVDFCHWVLQAALTA